MFLRAMKATLLAIAVLPACLSVRSDTAPQPHSRMARLPRVTLWAWDRPENLSSADPARFAIAYLDQTLAIGLTVHAQPRRDPVIFPAAAAVSLESLRCQLGAVSASTHTLTIDDIFQELLHPASEAN